MNFLKQITMPWASWSRPSAEETADLIETHEKTPDRVYINFIASQWDATFPDMLVDNEQGDGLKVAFRSLDRRCYPTGGVLLSQGDSTDCDSTMMTNQFHEYMDDSWMEGMLDTLSFGGATPAPTFRLLITPLLHFTKSALVTLDLSRENHGCRDDVSYSLPVFPKLESLTVSFARIYCERGGPENSVDGDSYFPSLKSLSVQRVRFLSAPPIGDGKGADNHESKAMSIRSFFQTYSPKTKLDYLTVEHFVHNWNPGESSSSNWSSTFALPDVKNLTLRVYDVQDCVNAFETTELENPNFLASLEEFKVQGVASNAGVWEFRHALPKMSALQKLSIHTTLCPARAGELIYVVAYAIHENPPPSLASLFLLVKSPPSTPEGRRGTSHQDGILKFEMLTSVRLEVLRDYMSVYLLGPT